MQYVLGGLAAILLGVIARIIHLIRKPARPPEAEEGA